MVRDRAAAGARLLRLVNESARRLHPRDNQRRRDEWVAELGTTSHDLTNLPLPPSPAEMIRQLVVGGSKRDQDGVSRALSSLADALGTLTSSPTAGNREIRASHAIEQAIQKLDEALEDAEILLAASEREVCERILEEGRRLQRLLVAVHLDQSVASKVKGKPDVFPATLDQLSDDASERQLAEEQRALEEAFEAVDPKAIVRLDHSERFPSSVDPHCWLIAIEPAQFEALLAVTTELRLLDRRPVDPPLYVLLIVNDKAATNASKFSHLTEHGLIPVQADEHRALVEQLDLQPPRTETVEAVTELITLLGKASLLAALQHHRPTEWPTTKPTAHDVLSHAAALIQDPIKSNHPDIALVASELLDLVESECRGQHQRVLAGRSDGYCDCIRRRRVRRLDLSRGDRSH